MIRKMYLNLINYMILVILMIVCSLIMIDGTQVASASINTSEATMVTGQIQSVSKIYGDADPTIVIVDNGLVLDLPIVFKREAGEDVGEYIIIVDTEKSEGYDCTAVNSGILTINQREIEISVMSAQKTYGEFDNSINFGYFITKGELQLEDNVANIDIIRSNKSEDYGSYAINIDNNTLKIANSINEDVNKNYNIKIKDNFLVINKLNLTIASNDISAIFGDNLNVGTIVLPEAIFGNVFEVVYSELNSLVIGISKIEFSVITKKDDKNTSAEVLENINLNLVYGTLTISRKVVNIHANNLSVVYGAYEDITYENDDNDLVNEHRFSGNLSREDFSRKNVGEYVIILGRLTVIDDMGNDVLAGYDLKLNNAKVIIVPKEISITFDSVSSIYGEAEFDFYEYNEELCNLLVYEKEKDVEFIRDNVENSFVGEYKIVMTKKLSLNYSVELINDNYTVKARALTIKIEDYEKEYGTADSHPVIQLVSGSMVEYDELDLVIDREEGETIGEYKLAIVVEKSGQYLVTLSSSVLTIVPKRLQVTNFIVSNKVFDGTTTALLFNVPVLVGVVDGEDVALSTNYIGRFVSAQIGDNKEVIVDNLLLLGKDKDNYEVVKPKLFANITLREVGDDNLMIIASDYSVIRNGSILEYDSVVAKDRYGLSDALGGFQNLQTVLASYKINIIKDDIVESMIGSFQIKIKIPKEFESIYKIKITAIDEDGNVVMLNTYREGNYVVADFDEEYESFSMVAEDTSWIIYTAIILGSISALIFLIFGTNFVVRIRNKKN